MNRLKFNPDTTYFTSDPHYNHSSIVLGTTGWVTPPYPYNKWPSVDKRTQYAAANGLRDFSSLEAMNKALVDGINDTVGQEDTLI
jgi:calcineurin-like phosphoesterase family protein